jgi:hypothetical protein
LLVDLTRTAFQGQLVLSQFLSRYLPRYLYLILPLKLDYALLDEGVVGLFVALAAVSDCFADLVETGDDVLSYS